MPATHLTPLSLLFFKHYLQRTRPLLGDAQVWGQTLHYHRCAACPCRCLTHARHPGPERNALNLQASVQSRDAAGYGAHYSEAIRGLRREIAHLEGRGGGSGAPGKYLAAHGAAFQKGTNEWSMPPVQPDEDRGVWRERSLPAEVVRQGVYIRLATADQGSQVRDPAVILAIQAHVNTLLKAGELLSTSQYTCSLRLPFVIAGSCTVRPEQQRSLAQTLRYSRYEMRYFESLCDLLDFLWNDNDSQAYGLYGLSVTMEKH